MTSKPRKTRVTMTEADLWHLTITMDTIIGAGSENDDDAYVAKVLKRACRYRGWRAYFLDRTQTQRKGV